MWWKKNKWKVLAPILVLLALTAAFLWQGGALGGPERSPVAASASHRASPPPVASPTATPSATPPALTPTPSASPSAVSTPTPTVEPPSPSGSPAVVQTPTPSAEPSPTPTPSPATPPSEPTGPATCTVSISCATLLDHLDQLTEGTRAQVPQDGWVLTAQEVEFAPGESALDVLTRVCREEKLHLEFDTTGYVEGISNLYQFDCGELSGWMYKVNGTFPNYGCGSWTVSDGDVIQWVYTCDLGEDVGGGVAVE